MYPIVDILCSSLTMNTHSKKQNIAHQDPMEHLDNDALDMLKQNKVRCIPTGNQTFQLGIVLDYCAVHVCANDIILTAD